MNIKWQTSKKNFLSVVLRKLGGGAAGIWTRVQTKYQKAFYMFSSQLNCRVRDRSGNPPSPYLILWISPNGRDLPLRLARGLVDVRHAVYQASSVQHKSILRPGLRLPWHNFCCHLNWLITTFCEMNDHSSTCLLTNRLSCRFQSAPG